MSLLDTLRSGIKIADSITKPLQTNVTYQRAVTTQDGYQTLTYPTSVQLRAIVDFKSTQVRSSSGVLVMSRATVMLLDVAAVVAATGGQGIDDNDVFTLPDASTAPILNQSGFMDAGTGHPVATEIYLG